MKHTIEHLPGSQVKIKIELTTEEFAPYKKKAAEEISRAIDIKGFRKGFAPLEMVEKHVGAHALLREALEHALQETYAKAVLEEKLDVITKPKIDIIAEEPLVYEATVAVMPEVEVKDHKSIKIPLEEVKIEGKEIEDVLKDLQRRRAEYKDIARAVKKGDKVELDFEGFDEGGASLEGTKSKNHPVIIGEKTLLEDFETQLEGMKTGDKKEFEITFPTDYHHKPFANKKVKFKIEVKKTQEVILPEITDEFVEKVAGEKMAVADFKKRVGENLETHKKRDAEAKREDTLIEKILEHTEVEVPALLLEEEVAYMLEEIKHDMEHRGFKFEDYLKQRKKTEDEIKKELGKEAEKRIKIRFALQHLFQVENIKVEDKEVNEEIEKIAASYPEKEQDKTRKELQERENFMRLKNRIALQKLFQLFWGQT